MKPYFVFLFRERDPFRVHAHEHASIWRQIIGGVFLIFFKHHIYIHQAPFGQIHLPFPEFNHIPDRLLMAFHQFFIQEIMRIPFFIVLSPLNRFDLFILRFLIELQPAYGKHNLFCHVFLRAKASG